MLSLTLETLSGDQILMPVATTVFKQVTVEGNTYVVAYHNNDEFALKTTMNELHYMIRSITQPPSPIHLPNELKGL